MFFKARINKRLPAFILDINIEIKEGEYTIMLGPNGAGKSMTLKIIAGIESATEQKIILKDKDISMLPPEKRSIVYLPQINSLFPHMNVYKNVIFPFYANKRKVDNELLDRVIETFKIGNLLKRLPAHLSGGEARRVALARAICAKPVFLLLDEPLSSLDFYMKLELIEFLKKIPKEYKITVLHVTHDPLETLMLAQRIYMIKDGKIVSQKDLSENLEKDDIFKMLLPWLILP